MNNKAISLIRNFSYTISSNLVTLIISTVVILIIPRYIGVEEYGYWQLYLFYSSYIGFLHFGWNDGIYLRYGGEEYSNLNKRKFNSQFHMLLIVQMIFFIFLIIGTYALFIDRDKIFIFIMTTICMILVNMRYMLLYILQATNRIKEYAKVTMIDRILYALLIIGFLIIGLINFRVMIFFDLIGKAVSLLLVMYYCRDIVCNRLIVQYKDILEMFQNINVGIKLMFSNIASKLIIGNVRFSIEKFWSVAVFGKISLILSINSFVMLFINAVGIVLFPILRRNSREKFPVLYKTMRDLLMVILFAILIGYYPIKTLLSMWLPEYKGSLIYMGLLFPTIIYESKMGLLLNTFYKTLRREKLLLKINIITLIISLTLTIITAVMIRNLDLVILTIILVIAFRAILSEILLSKIIGISVIRDTILEGILVGLFIVSAWFIDFWIIIPIYSIGYLLYLLFKRKDLIVTVNNFNEIFRNKKEK